VKEKDYIVVSVLARVCVVQDILSQIVVKNNPYIEEDEWVTVNKLLCRWSDKMVDESYPLDLP